MRFTRPGSLPGGEVFRPHILEDTLANPAPYPPRKAQAHRTVPPRAPVPPKQPPKQPIAVATTGPMMFEGVLTVKWISGRNGDFAVGDLKTSIDATFKIKDSLLDQFEEGSYAGRFWISAIYPTSYAANGRITVEVRATLVDLQITDESEAPPAAPTLSEPDPVDEAPPPAAVRAQAPHPSMPSKQQSAVSKGEGDAKLFGAELFDLVDQRLVLKLDPTIGDRMVLRQQRDRLKALGYSFDAMTQQWLPPQ